MLFNLHKTKIWLKYRGINLPSDADLQALHNEQKPTFAALF